MLERAHVVPTRQSIEVFDDKENQGPGGYVPWTGVQPSPAQTDAADLKISRKPWRNTEHQPGRTVLSDITPLFKRTAVSCTESHVLTSRPPPTPQPLLSGLAHKLHDPAFCRARCRWCASASALAGEVSSPRMNIPLIAAGRVARHVLPHAGQRRANSKRISERHRNQLSYAQGLFTDKNVMAVAEAEPMLQRSDSMQKKVRSVMRETVAAWHAVVH